MRDTLIVGLIALAGCAAAPTTPDALVTELVARCQQQHAPMPTLNSPGDLRNLHQQVLAADHDRLIDALRSPEGRAALERGARDALDPVTQFCTLEGLVRIDPARARQVWTALERDPNLAYYVRRDDYLREALKPYPNTPVR